MRDGRVFICGGTDGLVTLADAYVYDPRNDTYDRVADLPGERFVAVCCTYLAMVAS